MFEYVKNLLGIKEWLVDGSYEIFEKATQIAEYLLDNHSINLFKLQRQYRF